MSDNENEIFEKPKIKKVKKELSDERKQELRDQLSKARAVAKERREANKKKVDEMAKSEDITMTETEGDIDNSMNNTVAPASPAPETTDDETNNILQLQMDIEEARLKKKEKTDKKKKGVFANKKKQLNLDELVEKKVNEKLSKLNNKNNLENSSKPQEKKVSINSTNIELPKPEAPKPEAPKPKPKPISSFSRPWWSN